MTSDAISLPVRPLFRRANVLPGFGLTMGFTLTYLSLIVLIPLTALVIRPWELGWSGFFAAITQPRVLAALELTFGASLIAAGVNAVFGLLLAWVLTRYRFPGKRVIDAMVDLPFALPTAVAGIALATLYAPNGWIGAPLMQLFALKVAYTPLGIILAMIFIGLPFVVRTVQPVLQDFDRDVEEAAATLGARRYQVFFRIILPGIMPAWITGFAMAFARAVGEYGSIVFIAGNMPMKSEIAALLIIIKLEQFDYAGAAAIGVAMLAASFVILLLINTLQRWAANR
ncbi:MAG: sulfate ABC transporter permease subunit CysT [Alphaproteobacteria bacterium]|nr:sulfate ABC transporter permease subunit CysT [Alphaproteobacteria bacterium]